MRIFVFSVKNFTHVLYCLSENQKQNQNSNLYLLQNIFLIDTLLQHPFKLVLILEENLYK